MFYKKLNYLLKKLVLHNFKKNITADYFHLLDRTLCIPLEAAETWADV
jgi:hypothetical protein